MSRFITFAAILAVAVLCVAGAGARGALALTPSSGTPILATPYPRELPSTGTVDVPAIVLDFADTPASMSPEAVAQVIFGVGTAEKAPFESLSAFYRRSSYGQLEITGDVLGVYHVPSSRSAIDQRVPGARARLVAEALAKFDADGTDFTRFDRDRDGRLDYLIVLWAGPATRGSMWWGSYTVGGSDVLVDGETLGAYAWVPLPTDGSARTLVHETGHALGLADLYDANRTTGPGGGVGAFDPMGDGSGDLNALSKMMLGWLTPHVVRAGTTTLTLRPTSVAPDAAIVMPRYSLASPNREFYLVQARSRTGNDAAWPYEPTSALQVWHVDARVGADGRYQYNNSSTSHKFLSLVEADGLGEIERFDMSNAADLFHAGSGFSAGSTPSSRRYDGTRSGVAIGSVRTAAAGVTFSASAAVSAVPRGRQGRGASYAAARSSALRRH